ncbi:MAG: 3'-5' exonuclease, partial [Bacteroidales bacterium]
EFNNSFFRYSPEVIQEQFRSEYLDAGLPEDFADDMAEQIGSAYAEQSQKLPEGEDREGGFVHVKFSGNSNRDWKDKVLHDLPGLLNNILSRGYSRKDIAILVRNKRDGNEIAKALMDWQAEHGMESAMKLEFISEEFLLLQESVSIHLLLALMGYLVDPADRINKAIILNEYHRYLQANKGVRVPDQDLFGSIAFSNEDRSDNLLPDDFISRKEELGQLSLYELVEQLISVFGLSDHDSELPYLMAFQDVVLDYSRKEGGGIAPFIEWWQEHSSTLSVSSNERQDALRIMTIHKAKGLQFKVVLIPFADWDIDHNPLHDNFLWCRPVIKPFEKLDLVPVKYSRELAGSIFARDYFNEKMQVFVDNLNLLYVAFTRAEEELYSFAPLPEEKKANKEKVKSISDLLYRILPAAKPEEERDTAGEGGKGIITTGDWKGDLTNRGDQKTDPGDTTGHLIDAVSHDMDLAISGGKWNDEEKIFTMGKRGESPGTVDSATDDELVPGRYHVNDFMNKLRLRPYGNLFFSGNPDTGKRIDHGKLMHEIFENIITSKDIEKAVMQKCHEGIISRNEAREMIDIIRSITGKKEVARWFDGSWRVRNETAILLKGGKTRRPDRVMIKEGQVVVVDYKFGGQLQARYKNQVRRYMTELKEMGYRNLKGYVWYPLIGKMDEVDIINPELDF